MTEALANAFAVNALPWHGAFLLIALSYWLSDLFGLRILAIIGIVLALFAAWIAGIEPGMLMVWGCVILLVNLIQLAFILQEKTRHRLPAAEAAMLRDVFPSLKDAEIARLIKAADWKDFSPSDILTRQDVPVDALYFLCSGRASVQVDKSLLTYLEKGSFVGEIAYLTGNPATATVVIEEPSRVLVFSRMRMAKVIAADPETNSILYQLLGRDLAAKMRRSNTRRVLKDPDDSVRL